MLALRQRAGASPPLPPAASGVRRAAPCTRRGSGSSSSRRAACPPAAAQRQQQGSAAPADTASAEQRSQVLDASAPVQRAQREQQEAAGLSYVQGPTDVPLLEETIGQCLARTTREHPDADAVVSLHQGARLTYRDFYAQVGRVARGLLALGMQPSDRVAVWAPNCVEWVVLQFAAARVGAILVNINPAYRASELSYALTQAGVSTLVLAPGLRGGREFAGTLDGVRGQLPHLKQCVLLGDDTPLGYMSWAALAAGGDDASLEAALAEREAGLRPGDAVNIQYTSGTTGFPKAATLSHRNILNNALFIARTCRYTAADRVCIPVPLFHCFGMVIGNLAAVCSGAAIVYPSESFSPRATLEAVQAQRCTSLLGVPAMFIAELALPNFGDFQLSSLRTGVMAGSTCPVEVMKQVREAMHMSEITICMGMTETSPVSFQSHTDDPVDRRVSTVGRVHPWLEAKVVDPGSGRTVPRGTVGELCVRGYSVMLGYWGDDASTAAAIDQEGWMRTGDLATLDAQGYCSVVGRMRDMVIRGGENIYPREIEELLHSHPAVADVQVFGVPSKLWGEEVCAWVKLRDGSAGVGRAELRAWCSVRIARFKVPRHWRMVESFPMTVSGKAQKYKMRGQMIAELGRGGGGGSSSAADAKA